ncbi:reverse transcriptase domain-containing protein [Tanacetum coccineum]
MIYWMITPWGTTVVVDPILDSVFTSSCYTANEFAIKGEIKAFSQHEGETLIDAWLRMKEILRNCHGHNLSKGGIIKIFYHGLSETTQEVLNAAADGPSNTDTERIMAQMDVMTMKMDAQYEELQSQSKQSTLDENNDDLPMSREKEAKFMQTFHKIRFTIITATPKLGDPGSLLIPCNFNKAFSCNALADLGASINLMPYSLYAKLSLGTLKPTKISVRLADRSFKYPVRIAKNMLVEVGKFTFPIDFVIIEMEEDSKIPLILGRLFLHTTDVVIQVKQKQLTLRVGTERMIFNIVSAIKHSYSNDDTCFSIDVIDEILEEDFDALLDEGSQIIHSIEGTILEEKLFAEFDEFIVMTANEDSENESEEEPEFKKITINTYYKIKTSLEEPPTDL